jgi:2-polyprenyl-3-methyl-5-hydroxy-6-metoxy-1,4-benzoquinol methylase
MVPADALHILDAGCSNGALGRQLKADAPKRRVEGIEYSQTYCREAAGFLDHVVNADLNSFDWTEAFPRDRFDCIIFADVLEHLVNPWHTLRHAANRLKPGGCIIVSLPNIRHVSALRAIFLGGTFPRLSRGLFDETHLRWFTFRDSLKLLDDAGLTLVDYSCNLRVRDKYGGQLNDWARKVFARHQHSYLVREFLAYQFVLKAVVKQD